MVNAKNTGGNGRGEERQVVIVWKWVKGRAGGGGAWERQVI